MSNEIPGSLKAWAIVDIVLGGLGVIGGLVRIGSIQGVVQLLFAAFMIVVGIGLLGAKAWSKLLGFIMTGVGALLCLLGIIRSFVVMAKISAMVDVATRGMGRYGSAARAFAGGFGKSILIATIIIMIGMGVYFAFHFLSIKKHQDKLTS